MIVYRICKLYPPDNNPIDGKGAAKYGGRWNSEGVKVIYTASSVALARSELARHINLEAIPDGYRIYEIEIPNQAYKKITVCHLIGIRTTSLKALRISVIPVF